MSLGQQLKDLRQINRLGIREALSAAEKIRDRATRAFLKHENMFEVRDILLGGYQTMLVDSMMASYLRGYTRIESEALGKTIRFSELDDLNRALQEVSSLESVEALQEQLNSRAIRVLEGTTNKVEQKLRTVVNELAQEGASVKTGKERLNTAFNDLGLTPANSYTIENIFRTQTQLIYGAAKDHAEQAPAIQEILFGHKYSTVGDNRVRDEHKVWEGVIFEKGDPLLDIWYPPNGWSCRCMVIPLFSRPPGRMKKPPRAVPEIDPDFSFRPGSIIAQPTLAEPVVQPKSAIAPPMREVVAKINLDPAGIKVNDNGVISVQRAKSIARAKKQLAYITELRDAAVVNAESVKHLPKNDPERVKALLQLKHAVEQYKRVVNNVKKLLG